MKIVKMIMTGFGNVGYNFVRNLMEKHNYIKEHFELDIRIVSLVGSKYRIYEENGICLERLLQCSPNSKGILEYDQNVYPIRQSLDGIENVEADVLVEATPTNIETGEPGYSHIKRAFEKGMDVVTLSKGALVCHYKELIEEAKKHNRRIKVSGATAAALPTIDMAQYNLVGNDIYKIQGVLNGTTNYILTKMHKDGISYESALKEAQAKGIAEANPKLDVGGFDTASKLLILTNSIMDTQYTINDMEIEGIEKIKTEDVLRAKEENKTIKLVGEAYKENNQVKLRVVPIALDNSNLLTKADYKDKAIVFYTDLMGTISVIGGGSDPKAAAAAALKDVINLYK